jgi:dTMP kinase
LKNKDFVLSDEEIHKLFSENRWESIGNIKSKLLSGKNVILDRYAYSGVVFTAAKVHYDPFIEGIRIKLVSVI